MEQTTSTVELRAQRGDPAAHHRRGTTSSPQRRGSSLSLHTLWSGLGRIRAEARQLAAVDKKIVLAMSIHGDLPAAPSGPIGFEPGERRHVNEVGRLSEETRAELRYMRERLDRGDRFFIGRYGDQLAFNAWLMFGEMELGSGTTPTAPDVAYSYKVFSAPKFRRFGIARSYYAFVIPFLARLGYRRLVCHVRHNNIASLRLHHAVGFRRVGTIWDAHLGFIRRAVLISEAPPALLPAFAR